MFGVSGKWGRIVGVVEKTNFIVVCFAMTYNKLHEVRIMGKSEEVILLYCFTAGRLTEIQAVLHDMKIKTINCGIEVAAQKVGFLLGLKGFAMTDTELKVEPFAKELLIFNNINRVRMDKILAAFRQAGIAKINYKAMVTPYNMFWTIQRLGQTMEKEHGAIIKQAAMKSGENS